MQAAVENTCHATFYRRDLLPPSVPFNSPEGREYFKESLAQGYLECYFPLAEQFTTQSHPSFCGLGSLTMTLNALSLDPGRTWKGPWRWFDDSMLDCCKTHNVIMESGITLRDIDCLANCNGASVVLNYAIQMTEDKFREDIKKITSAIPSNSFIIVSYNRRACNQTGSGHFSPIGGYNSSSDRVLIMDVARFKVRTFISITCFISFILPIFFVCSIPPTGYHFLFYFAQCVILMMQLANQEDI